MSRIPLGALTTLNLSTHLDPQFTELYQLRDLTTVSGVNVGFGAAPIEKLTVVSTPGSGFGVYRDLDVGTVGTNGVLMNLGSRIGTTYTPGCALVGSLMATTGNNGQFSVQVRNASALVERLILDNSGNLYGGADNSQTLGTASRRWSTVYAGTGAINTSDAREKTPVSSLSDAEIDAAMDLGRELGKYKFLQAVADKGEEARTHIGMTVQRAIEIMEDNGLDPFDYAFICHDEWETGDPENPRDDRYSFRSDELALFIAAGQQAAHDHIEARLAALEDPNA